MTESAAQPRVPQSQLPLEWSLADLRRHLGRIPLERIRLFPPPGLATEGDVVELAAREDRLYELEDGTLVEKPKGWEESVLALFIGTQLNLFLATRDLGVVSGADGPYRILPGKVKIPDVSFVSWERLGSRKGRRPPVLEVVPDLAVEVISEGNTDEEMDDKLQKYFQAGVRLVWYVYPGTRSAKVYTSPHEVTEIDGSGFLEGGDVLPGFRLSLRGLFEKGRREGPAANAGR